MRKTPKCERILCSGAVLTPAERAAWLGNWTYIPHFRIRSVPEFGIVRLASEPRGGEVHENLRKRGTGSKLPRDLRRIAEFQDKFKSEMSFFLFLGKNKKKKTRKKFKKFLKRESERETILGGVASRVAFGRRRVSRRIWEASRLASHLGGVASRVAFRRRRVSRRF